MQISKLKSKLTVCQGLVFSILLTLSPFLFENPWIKGRNTGSIKQKGIWYNEKKEIGREIKHLRMWMCSISLEKEKNSWISLSPTKMLHFNGPSLKGNKLQNPCFIMNQSKTKKPKGNKLSKPCFFYREFMITPMGKIEREMRVWG